MKKLALVHHKGVPLPDNTQFIKFGMISKEAQDIIVTNTITAENHPAYVFVYNDSIYYTTSEQDVFNRIDNGYV